MSVNISSKEFAHPNLAKAIAEVVKQTGLDPSYLQLEITETIAMGNPEKAASVLSELKSLGVRLSVDDFGTGYSSLSRLQQFPVDSVKIDRAFISQMDIDAESHKIVQVIIMDGGIRRGSDIVKAICLGAKAVLCGRAYAYGLAAAGEAGVTRAFEILRADVDRTLKLLGCTSIAALDRSYVDVPTNWR